MKRSKHPIMVWPSIADLMTVIAVMAIYLGVAHGGCDRQSTANAQLHGPTDSLRIDTMTPQDSIAALVDSVAALEDSAAALEDSIAALEDSIAALEDEFDDFRIRAIKDKFGHVPCLGLDASDQPRAFATIGVGYNEYRIAHSWTGDSLAILAEASAVFTGPNPLRLEAEDFRDVASKLYDYGRSQDDCRYWPRIENDGVHRDSLGLLWLREISPYFGGAVNPDAVR